MTKRRVSQINFTTREMNAETEITGIVPKKESAAMAPMAGNIKVKPLKMLRIFAAAMLFMLNTCIRKTIKFTNHPNVANVKPNRVTAP